MTEKERMLSGKADIAQDEEPKRDSLRAKRLTRLFNGTRSLLARMVSGGRDCRVRKRLKVS